MYVQKQESKHETNVSPLVKQKRDDMYQEKWKQKEIWIKESPNHVARLPPDPWVMVTKSGVVGKSRAFAPTYPQFVMRNSDLRCSC